MELLERDNFIALLHSGFKKILLGEGHCFFIMGESGIGKTSLVKAFLNQVEDESIQYVGACDSLFTPRPLAPLYDIALQIKQDWTKNIDSIASRTELFTKFRQEFADKNKPVIVVFEDVHWADEATLDFVKLFARRISRIRCMVILTCRDDEMSQQHSVRNVLGDLSADTFTRIHLTPLSRQTVYQLADVKGYDAENVFNISGGNPFYVNEILATYSPGVPDNIKDAILAVYDRQGDGTKNAWQMCSVIPEGLEVKRFAKLRSSWDQEMDHCFAMNVLVVKNERVFFKHELYRRTIENSLSPFKRITLNKKILELFLDSFEREGEIERIVQYAKNANENEVVVKYAPLAAKQAAAVGAHMEASKLFLTAIEYSDGSDTTELVKFYQAYSYECYLTNQIKEAITYQSKALRIWQEKNEIEQIGNSLQSLSKLWWLDCNHDEAEKYGKQAIEILQAQPSSKAKVMAFVNMLQLTMFSTEGAEAIRWGTLGIEMAREINDDEILCYALSTVGLLQWNAQSSKEVEKQLLTESLNIALKNGFHEQAGRAYSYIIYCCVDSRQYELAKQFLQHSINYSEERDLDTLKNYKLYLMARMLLETGYWRQADIIIDNLLANPNQLGTIKTGALIVKSSIEIRRGESDPMPLLQEARTLAFKAKEHHRVIPLMIALLEYEWLTSKRIITDEELKIATSLVKKLDNISLNSDFEFWLKKAGREEICLPNLYEPYQLLQAGKIGMAVGFWEKIGCPFEKAFALCEGDESDKKNALLIFQELGATAVCEKVKMEMRAQGIKKIPRGIRESTRMNPAQLTNRELDVLQLLKNAIQNKEIAETLFISPKTVDHHITSILFKLDVKSRSKAVTEAARLGILK